MPDISLKNTNGTGPRGVIDVKGVHHVIQMGETADDIEVDDHTATWLAEAWENGGDLEVTSGAPVLKAKKVRDRNEPEVQRAKLSS
jgi:hypothetical protein